MIRVRLEPAGAGRYRVRVGGGTWREVDFVPGSLLLEEGRSVSYAVARNGAGLPSEIQFRGLRIPLEVLGMGVRPGHARGGASLGAASGGRVTAPMNGQVVKVLSRAGERVGAGQVVLVLEAMKMENEVASPLEGVLQEVAVEEGQSVQPGCLLFVVNPDGRA